MARQSITRRMFARGVAVAPLASAEALADTADAVLVAKELQLNEAHRLMDAAFARLSEIERSLVLPNVGADDDGPVSAAFDAALPNMTVADLANRNHPANVAFAEDLQRRECRRADVLAERARLRREAGADLAQDAADDLCSSTLALAMEILETPIDTLSALLLKLRVADKQVIGAPDIEHCWDTIAADIRRIAAKAGVQ
jgi:hypothetical protein